MEIKTLFDEYYKGVDFNAKFSQQIDNYVKTFLNKGENTAFFGSGLLAVERVRWTSTETGMFFDDIVKVNQDDLKGDIDQLDCIDPSHIVTTDAFNLSLIYCTHRVLANSKLSLADKRKCAINLIRILHFKFVCGILAHYFPHGSDVQIALRTYEAMNNRFDLKIYKTWGKLITARATTITSPQSIHARTLQTFTDDDAILYVLSDIQTRIRVVIKTITALYYKIREKGDKVVSTSALVEVDGTLEVRDIKRQYPRYRRYIFETLTDPISFIRLELVDILLNNMPTAQRKAFLSTLQYLSINAVDPFNNTIADRSAKKDHTRVTEFVERTLEYAFDFIHSKGINPKNLPELIGNIKTVLNASRNKEPEVMYLRTAGDTIVRLATGKKEPTPVSPERTVLVLYIILRTLTMAYYQR